MFNNAFYEISDIVECPIIIYGSDSPLYFSNRNSLNNERYMFFVPDGDSCDFLVELGVDLSHIYKIPFFTEVVAEEKEKKCNISFIASLFTKERNTFVNSFVMSNPTRKEVEDYRRCVEDVRKKPFIQPQELFEKNKITSRKIVENLYVPHLTMLLSDEKRISVLENIQDLGLEIYGTQNWGTDYFYNIALNLSFVNKYVYSKKHNEDIYNSSKIGISISHIQARKGFPWRIMDIMASNACLLSDEHMEFSTYFPNAPIQTFKDKEEARIKCIQLLKDEKMRKEIVSECQSCIEKNYRLKHFLKVMEQILGIHF